MSLKKIRAKIREVPDWPVKGVNFKDVTTLLEDGLIFREVIRRLCRPYLDLKIDKLVAIDARGFLFAAAMAYRMKTGVCLVRKKGKLPYRTIEQSYEKEYGPDTLTMHKDTVKRGERVVIVDDLLATGGTILAAVELVEKLGGKIMGISCVIDLPFLGGSKKLIDYEFNYLVKYDSE